MQIVQMCSEINIELGADISIYCMNKFLCTYSRCYAQYIQPAQIYNTEWFVCLYCYCTFYV